MKIQIESIVSYLKGNSEFLLFSIVGITCYICHGSTLITTFRYYILLLIVSFVICLFIKSFRASKSLLERLKRIFEVYLILYLIFFLAFCIASKQCPKEIHIVPLNSYSTYKADAVYFRFQGDKFMRYCHKGGLTDGNNDNKYNVRLCLRQPLKDAYYLEYLQIVEK